MEYIIPKELVVISSKPLHSSVKRDLGSYESIFKGHPFSSRIVFNKKRDGFVHYRYFSHKVQDNYIYLDINKKYEKLTGFSGKDVIGKYVTEVAGKNKEYAQELIKKFYRTAEKGEVQFFDLYSPIVKKQYSIFCYSPKKHFFTLFFNEKNDSWVLENRNDAKKVFEAINRAGSQDSVILEKEHPLDGNRYKKVKIVSLNTAEELGIAKNIHEHHNYSIIELGKETVVPDAKKKFIIKNTETEVEILTKFSPGSKELLFMINK